MTTVDWHSAIAERCKHLAGLGKLPPPSVQDPALRAVAVLSVMAETDIRHALIAASTRPSLTVPAYTGSDPTVDDLIAKLIDTVSAPSRGLLHHTLSASCWLSGHGLDELVVRSVEYTADDSGRTVLLSHAAAKANEFAKKMDRLQNQHMEELLERDAPDFADNWRLVEPSILAWILAHQHDGDPMRKTRVTRRLQALQLYASVADRLRNPAITDIIDNGSELVPALTERLSLTRAQLRVLREAVAPEQVGRYFGCKYEYSVRQLLAHAVPLHQWPGGGRAGQHAAWQCSPWLKSSELTLIRADYYGADATTVRDATRSFEEDLLHPLLGEIAEQSGSGTRQTDFRLCALVVERQNMDHDRLEHVRSFLASIRRALIGERGPKAFQEAARIWHRRAAAVAALRNENQADRPGWPPLCPPWTAPCGTFQIVPLTTAKMLVEEGNAHQHCVGTYYDQCRSGHTQILSLRAHGKPAVTAEILLDGRIASLRVGQFKGLHDEVPDDPVLLQAMRAFLRDLRSGTHPLNRQELRTYRTWADENVQTWSSDMPSIAHAREVFPLYLPLLPRGTPADFDRWCDTTGLKEGLRAALRALTRHASKTA